jgi:hypothetical protein
MMVSLAHLRRSSASGVMAACLATICKKPLPHGTVAHPFLHHKGQP